MQFISKNQQLRVIIQPDITEYTPMPGRSQPLAHIVQHDITAEFKAKPLNATIRRWAVETFENNPHADALLPAGFTGLGSPVDMLHEGFAIEGAKPEFSIGVFDTDKLEPALAPHKAKIEDVLLNHPDLGTLFIVVPEVKAPKPFPSYGRLTTKPEDIVKLIERLEDGDTTPEAVIAYEVENDNRKTILTAVEEYKAKQPVVWTDEHGVGHTTRPPVSV